MEFFFYRYYWIVLRINWVSAFVWYFVFDKDGDGDYVKENGYRGLKEIGYGYYFRYFVYFFYFIKVKISLFKLI